MEYRRIRELREDNDIKQVTIGKALGISQRSYSYYETGDRMIPPNILAALAKFHGVSTDYLLNLTDKKEPHY